MFTKSTFLTSVFVIGISACAVFSQNSQKAEQNSSEQEQENSGIGFQQRRFERFVHLQDFEHDLEDWNMLKGNYRSFVKSSVLTIVAEGSAPCLYKNFDLPRGMVRVNLKIRTKTPSQIKLFWLSAGSPRPSNDKQVHITLNPDGQWNEYETLLPVIGTMTNLSIEFKAAAGRWELDSIELWVQMFHPLSVKSIRHVGDKLHFILINRNNDNVKFRVADTDYTLGQHETADLTVEPAYQGALVKYPLRIEPENYPPFSLAAFHYNPVVNVEWIPLALGKNRLEIAPDGSMGRIMDGIETIAILAPLMHQDGFIPKWKPVWQNETSVKFQSDKGKMEIHVTGETAQIRIQTKNEPFEGPVLRGIGTMREALMAGCEFLDAGESSSQDIDIIAPYCDRFEPRKLWITMPLMAFQTTRGVIAMTWDDMTLQPTFLTPNQLDATMDHRMSLKGEKECHATVWYGQGEISDAVLWAVKHHGLPEIPPAPRSAAEQRKLNLAAFTGPLAGNDGTSWGICAEPEWSRKPFSDFASIVWRLSGKVPPSDMLEMGGAFISNDSSYFVSNKAYVWFDNRRSRILKIFSEQQPDGLFEYPSAFPEVDPEIPRVGIGARRAVELGSFALMTGNQDAFECCKKILKTVNQLTVPRGAHFWETPLHVPDLLCCAYLITANIQAYEYSWDEHYLKAAKKWAITGLPFVYLWSDRPKMLYSTIALYGASDRVYPIWFGTPRPVSGAVYGYSLAQLARYDQTLDWQMIARGILHAAESLQIESGNYIGCLPNGFSLETQEFFSWHINPASIFSLRMLLDSPPDGLSLAVDGSARIISPFRVKMTKTQATISDVPYGAKFQVMLNGSQVINVKNTGKEVAIPIK
ncbi:MAG: hypothetical protein LBQ54_13355 [Planctomycetaceae bacterium]|jgi:hypothetical protein|nr:hypothetical protein [Planctomycetaceae bacterium]